MNKIKNIYISYWFKELDYNPANKVKELEAELKSIIDNQLVYNDDKLLNNISMPRIQGISSDKKYLFTLSLLNAFLSINVSDLSYDEAILLINDNVQLVYDIIKKVYGVDILYTSIKVELVDNSKKSLQKLVKLFKLSPNNYEELSLKRGFIKDEYYINYILTYSKEYNFDVERKEGSTGQDLFDRSMLVSISEAKLNKEYILTVIEINDRYAYNTDKHHETNKDTLRGMIIELKEIFNKEDFNKI